MQNWPGQKISRIATHAFTFFSTLPVVFENLQIVLVAALLERFPRISQNMHDTWLSCPFSFAIGPVRYINILTWLRGFRGKIVNFLSFFCLSIPKRELDTDTKYRILSWNWSNVPLVLYCSSVHSQAWFSSTRHMHFVQRQCVSTSAYRTWA